MHTLGVLCTVVLFAFLKAGSCLDAVGGKLLTSERLLENHDVLHKDGNFDPLAPVSQHSELFEMAKRIASRKDSLEGRSEHSGGHQNNMDRFEELTKQFMELSIDISYSAVYLLQNYTRFVQNANNKYIIVFE